MPRDFRTAAIWRSAPVADSEATRTQIPIHCGQHSDDVVALGCPDELFGVIVVVFMDEAVDGGL